NRIPERLAPVVTNCLLKDRSKRWSAAQVIEYLSNRQNTTIAPKASSTPQPVSPEIQLKSDVGMDYNKLRDLLKAEKWQEADKETRRVMLAVAKREEKGWFNVESIDNFPCADLRTIDQLWVKYSDGKFGFSVQKRIYQGDVKLPTRIPERLAPVVTNCLLKERSKRWSAAQVIECLSNRQNTTIAPKASPTPQPVSPEVELKSDVGMDYRKLRDLLKAGEWTEAEEETRRVM
ncbi:MAG: GUN4 domain-containing protein, partial [Dolichospermum sp.]